MSAITKDSFHDITKNLFRARRPRTHQQVRRCSYHAGERETRRWIQCNTFGASEHNARMRAAEEFERQTKAPGKRNGALGHIALEILRFMLRLRNRKTGRLDPSYTWLAAQLHRSRSAVAAAMRRLKEHGFIDWHRRTQLVEEPTSDQYVEQISNAYFFIMPTKIAELVARMLRRPNAAQRRSAEEQSRQARAEKPIDDVLSDIDDPDLRASLERMRALVESANPPSGHNEAL